MKQSRFTRVLGMLTTLQSGQHCRINNLAEKFGLSRRTLYRDLKELRDIGVPCHYDKKNHCYKMDPDFFLPAPSLSAQEALGLLLLVYKARNHINIPFKNSALIAAIKIESNLPTRVKRYCNSALQNISIKNHPQIRADLLDKIFEKLTKAILNKRVVNIHYYLPHEQKDMVTNLSPYHLMYNDHAWYVLGKSSLHRRIRTFKLNLIRELSTLDKCFIEDKKFDVHEHIGRAWSMIPEGRLYNIKLRFLPEIAHSVAEVQWHSTQTVAFKDDGSVIIEFRIDGLNEIIWWVLSYGDQIE